MTSILIATGISNRFLSQEPEFRSHRDNVGARDAERLVGKGHAFGEGPLPIIVDEAAAARRNGIDCHLVYLLRCPDEATGQADDHITQPFATVRDIALKVEHSDYTVGSERLREVLERILGRGLRDSTTHDLQILVAGCHTDGHVLGAALYLRSVLGIEKVAVSPHLSAGSTPEAHYAALRHTLPSADVDVHLDVRESFDFLGLSPDRLGLGHGPCQIEPEETRQLLGDDSARIAMRLCMNWTRAQIRPLKGGFSGSLLLLADGWRGEARTEPLVLKIDRYDQMRKELSGYYQVKELLGKHVPTFGYPVSDQAHIGVGMELAAMEGTPQTLQDSFEDADSESSAAVFAGRLNKALELLSHKLYQNTRETALVVPYRVFGLHAERQLVWLRQNAELSLFYAKEWSPPLVDVDQLVDVVRVISRNEDGMESEVCLSHGDLNYANIICDSIDNIWFIDWTHSGVVPLELDFAKLECDAKFVMSKEFGPDDLPRLREFEEYLASNPIPVAPDELPEGLKFARWDFRFRKVLEAVRTIRKACSGLKATDDWLVYRVALLRYSMHTLSFDERRGRGECGPVQLMHALYSTEALALELLSDDFHLKIRGERPLEYPPRQRISIDEAPWLLDCETYDPPYYVHPDVVEADRTEQKGGWADPEDTSLIEDELAKRTARHRDGKGRPLNPRGRTGLAGRGLLGLWGPNLSVSAVVTRESKYSGGTEILLGRVNDEADLELPKGFVLPGEEAEDTLGRVLRQEVGLDQAPSYIEKVFEGYTYDPRQTDHAWIEGCSFHVEFEGKASNVVRQASSEFEEIHWWPLTADNVNQVPAGQSRFIRSTIEELGRRGRMPMEMVEELLSRTG